MIIAILCNGNSTTIETKEETSRGIMDEVEKAIVGMYEQAETVFEEFLEYENLEIQGLPLHMQVAIFAELKEQIDGDKCYIEGFDNAYPRMGLGEYLLNGASC